MGVACVCLRYRGASVSESGLWQRVTPEVAFCCSLGIAASDAASVSSDSDDDEQEEGPRKGVIAGDELSIKVESSRVPSYIQVHIPPTYAKTASGKGIVANVGSRIKGLRVLVKDELHRAIEADDLKRAQPGSNSAVQLTYWWEDAPESQYNSNRWSLQAANIVAPIRAGAEHAKTLIVSYKLPWHPSHGAEAGARGGSMTLTTK